MMKSVYRNILLTRMPIINYEGVGTRVTRVRVTNQKVVKIIYLRNNSALNEINF